MQLSLRDTLEMEVVLLVRLGSMTIYLFYLFKISLVTADSDYNQVMKKFL